MLFHSRSLAVAIATTVSASLIAVVPATLWQKSANGHQYISQASPEEGFPEAFSLIQQGMQYLGNGAMQSAITSFNESLAISRDIGELHLQGIALIARGKALLESGQTEAARTSLQEGLAIAQDLGDPELEALAQGVLAEME